MTQPKVTLRTKLAIVAAFLAVGLVGLYVGSPIQHYRESEETMCRDKCKKLERSWRLVSQNPVGAVNPGRYDGPWKCECF